MLKLLAGPLIGMVIGYCTNYIAVKMLFRPREAKYIFGHRVPLTPGAIPKGKERLATAVGEVVSQYLVTKEDISESLLDEGTENAVVDGVLNMMHLSLRDDLSMVAGSGENYEYITAKINNVLTEQVVESIKQMQLPTLIAEEGRRIINQLCVGTMLGMFINEATVDQLVAGFETELTKVFDERGESLVRPVVTQKMSELRDSSIAEVLHDAGVEEDHTRELLVKAYRSAVTSGVSSMLEHIDISTMIQNRINAMKVEELETLVMAVMKNELNTIVNLGALIGFVLGCLNLII